MATEITKPIYLVEPLGKHHDRSQFHCGIHDLDRYLHEQARQETSKRVAASFVLLERGTKDVVGYYTLSATGVDIGDWPDDVAKKLPKYPVTPATLLGRLAIDKRFQGQGLGEHLLLDALFRSWSLSEQIGSVAVVVEAKDDQARSFYARYGFLPFPERNRRLFIPMKTIAELWRNIAPP